MASNETSKYKLSVVEGTELQLSLGGAQGPAGPVGPVGPAGESGTINTGTSTNLTGFISGNGTTISGATAGDLNPTASTIVLRDTGARIHAHQIRLYNPNADTYTQINPSSSESTLSFQFPATAGTIATNNSAVMLSGDQLSIAGNKTFNGQIELTGQSATNGTSALTRDLGDVRYGSTYVGIKTENVTSTDSTPITLTSVTLPTGVYQIDSCIAATASASPNGGYVFGLRASSNIRLSLFEQYGGDSLSTSNSVAASDSTQFTQRAITQNTFLSNKRQLMGLLEVLTNNTVVSLEFSQHTTNETPSVTRKRAYIIARRIA